MVKAEQSTRPPYPLVHRCQRGGDVLRLLLVALPGQLQREHVRRGNKSMHHRQQRIAAACSSDTDWASLGVLVEGDMP